MEIEKVAPLSTSTSNSWALNEVHGPMTYTRVDRISKDAFSTEWVNSTPLGFTSRIRKKNFIGKSKPVASTFTNADMKTCGRTSSCSDDDYTICNDSMAVTTALNEEMRYSDAANGGGLAPPNNSSYLTVPVVNQSHSRRSNGHVEPNDISCVTNVTDLNDTEMATFQSVVNTGPVQLPLNKTENNNHKHNLFTMKKKRREADRKRKDKLEMKRERKAAKVLERLSQKS
ncbi:hypothetical protein MAR_006631 [Mya arenaria]|uniref:Uncharacterized protein n=1 Tax=Mya arenaria TaxID=6604 RepID=A0ABY7DGN6_MYAAR|nr:hypothetical protein MAR_006631 [Mya arenaria]